MPQKVTHYENRREHEKIFAKDCAHFDELSKFVAAGDFFSCLYLGAFYVAKTFSYRNNRAVALKATEQLARFTVKVFKRYRRAQKNFYQLSIPWRVLCSKDIFIS